VISKISFQISLYKASENVWDVFGNFQVQVSLSVTFRSGECDDSGPSDLLFIPSRLNFLWCVLVYCPSENIHNTFLQLIFKE
jgi:hypothetical protein